MTWWHQIILILIYQDHRIRTTLKEKENISMIGDKRKEDDERTNVIATPIL